MVSNAVDSLNLRAGPKQLDDGWWLKVDSGEHNFRFDSEGNVLGWFDPVFIDDKPW